jgi:DNA modification methylase
MNLKDKLTGYEESTKIINRVRHPGKGTQPVYKTKLGVMWNDSSETLLKSIHFRKFKGKINLIFTSPPFPLSRKKKYGNFNGDTYKEWLANFAQEFRSLLADNGSLVIEIGNAWTPGRPEMTTLGLESLMQILRYGDFSLCQQFVAYNKAKLPTPTQWVNVERIRVKDSFSNIWWMAKTLYPKANNRKVLVPYSESMKNLLKNGKYNAGSRPSEHHIGERSFLKDNGGAIPANVIEVSNTRSTDRYIKYCKANGITLHPARMPDSIPEFFIKFLTEPGDIVLDPFAGSNVTGAVSEKLGRKWISIEKEFEYAESSIGRFDGADIIQSHLLKHEKNEG